MKTQCPAQMFPNLRVSLPNIIPFWMRAFKMIDKNTEIQVYRGEEPFRVHLSSHVLLKFVEQKIEETKLTSSSLSLENGKSVYHIYDEDLGYIFDSLASVDLFWTILGAVADPKYTRFFEKLQEKGKNNKDCIKNEVNAFIPDGTPDIQRFKLVKLFMFGVPLGTNITFFLDILEDKIANKNQPRRIRRLKTLQWMVSELSCSAFEFDSADLENKKLQYLNNEETEGQPLIKRHRNELESKSITKRINDGSPAVSLAEVLKAYEMTYKKIQTKKQVSIMQEPKFIMCLLIYISKKLAKTRLCSSTFVEIKVAYIHLFCIVAAVLPFNTAKTLVTSHEKDLLKVSLTCVLTFFGLNEFKFILEEDPQKRYLETIRLLRNGDGIFCFNNSPRQSGIWIHIGNKTIKRINSYNADAMEFFWRALGNICHIVFETKNINITVVSSKIERSFVANTIIGIQFSNHISWNLAGAEGIHLGRIENRWSLLCHKQCAMVFRTPSITNDIYCADTITVRNYWENNFIVGENKSDRLLPPSGRYTKGYRFCDKSFTYIERNLKEIMSLKATQIDVNFVDLRCKHLRILMEKGKQKIAKLICEVINMLVAKIKNDESLVMITIYTDQIIFIDTLLETIRLTERCQLYIQCLASDESNCLIKGLCENKSKKSRYVTCKHRKLRL